MPIGSYCRALEDSLPGPRVIVVIVPCLTAGGSRPRCDVYEQSAIEFSFLNRGEAAESCQLE